MTEIMDELEIFSRVIRSPRYYVAQNSASEEYPIGMLIFLEWKAEAAQAFAMTGGTSR